MSYTTGGLAEVNLTSGTSVIDASGTGDKARWNPGYLPVIVRAVAVVLNAAPAGSNGVLNFDKRVTYGSDTGRVTGSVAIVKTLSTHAAGNVIYKDKLNVVINPGQEIVFNVGTQDANLTAVKVTLFIEPSQEMPANNTAMVATT